MKTGLLAVAGMLLVSVVHAAPAAAEARPRIEVSVDTSTLEPQSGERLQQALDDGVTAALREQGLEVVSRSDERRVEVRIEMLDAESREYAISLDIVLAGEREELIKSLECRPCSEASVIKQTVALVPAAARRIEAQRGPDSREAPTSESVQRLGPMGIVGISTMVGGLGSVVAGAILVENAPKLETSRQSGQAQGAALVSAGVTAALLGMTGLALDLTVFDRKRRGRNVNLEFEVSPTSAGLWVSGRF